MQIQIKNIGKIKEAIVNLSGLSVIAGYNDSGKTTVSKVVFSVIKAIKEFDKFSEISKENIIKSEAEKLYRHARFINVIISDVKYDNFYIKNNKKIIKTLDNYFNQNSILERLELNKNGLFFEDIKKNIENLKIHDILKEDLYSSVNRIREEYIKEDTKEYLVLKRLNTIFQSEFKGSLGCEEKEGIINITDFGKNLFEIKIKKNKVKKVKINDEFLQIKDSTFVESPIIINLFNDLSNESFNSVQYHYQDLFKKIKSIKSGEKRKNGFYKKVKKIIEGNFELSKTIGGGIELTFNKKGIDKNIQTINTATGIKSFGLLDLLDQANNLTENDLLILDEPEVHLHPAWQVLYAELIVKLIKERNLSVLITSHSPYMIEALSKYSKKELSSSLKLKASFYISEEKKSGKCIIEDKTEKKYEIFEKLSKPFRDLILK